MTLYPGWDSLDSVKTWHTVFEISGIVILALLVGAEILAFQYGHRKDELTAIAESNAETQRQADADAAETRRKSEVNSLQSQLAEAGNKVADLQAKTAHRRLKPEQKTALVEALSRFRGQKVSVAFVWGSDDGSNLADDFMEVFHDAGWDIKPGSPNQTTYGSPVPTGLEPSINQTDAEAKRAPMSFIALIETLSALGLMPPHKAFANPEVPSGEIEMRIGNRPG